MKKVMSMTMEFRRHLWVKESPKLLKYLESEVCWEEISIEGVPRTKLWKSN